jgi:hypothetical protein
MRSLILGIVLGIAGCHTAPVSCDAHLTPINRPVAVANGASTPPSGSAPDSRVSR